MLNSTVTLIICPMQFVKKRKKRKMTFACTSICTSHKTRDIYNFNTCIYIYERARVYRVSPKNLNSKFIKFIKNFTCSFLMKKNVFELWCSLF